MSVLHGRVNQTVNHMPGGGAVESFGRALRTMGWALRTLVVLVVSCVVALVVAANVFPGDNTGLRAALAVLTLAAVSVTGVAVNLLLDARRKSATSASEIVDTAATQNSLEEKIQMLLQSMQESAKLVEQVSAELDARAVTARQLQEEAKQAKAEAELNKEQAETVRRLVRSQMSSISSAESRKNFRDSVRLSIVFLIAGGLISALITLLVHPLH